MIDKSMKGKRLIFVGGAPRSGTTLVQNMLDSHPLIFGGPEFLHLPDLLQLRKKFYYSISVDYISIFCSKDDIDRFIVSWVESLFLPLADKEGCELYSEKTPENVLVFSELVELFSQSHFIQVIRDPRAIVSSMQQVKKRAIHKGISVPHFTVNNNTSIDYVEKCYAAGFAAEKKYPEKVLTVVYEQLLLTPELETKKICDFLGLDWSKDMLTPKDKKHLGEQAITTHSNELWYDKKQYNRNPDRDNIGKWKKNLSPYVQAQIILRFKDNKELQRYGYSLSFEGVPFFAQVLAKFGFLWSLLQRNIRKIFNERFFAKMR